MTTVDPRMVDPDAPVDRSLGGVADLPALGDVQDAIRDAIGFVQEKAERVVDTVASIFNTAGQGIEDLLGAIPGLDASPESLAGAGGARSPTVADLVGVAGAVQKVAEEGVEAEVTLGPSVFVALGLVGLFVLLRR